MSSSLFCDTAESYSEVPYIEGVSDYWIKIGKLKDMKAGDEVHIWQNDKYYKTKCQKEPYFDRKGFMCIKVEKTEGLKEVVFRFAHKRAPATLEYHTSTLDQETYVSTDRFQLSIMVGGKYWKERERLRTDYTKANRKYWDTLHKIYPEEFER